MDMCVRRGLFTLGFTHNPKCATLVKIAHLAVHESYPSISGFSFTTDIYFINYCSLDFQFLGGLICCCPTIEFKLDRLLL